MSHHTESRADAWTRRQPLIGSVDFTMMYVAHDAFNRDLERLIGASQAGSGLTPAAIATWRSFSKQLHTHHNAEDAALWPRLYAAVTDSSEHRSLKATWDSGQRFKVSVGDRFIRHRRDPRE